MSGFDSSINLVTGGAGFLGSHLIDHLLKKGEEVICVDNYSTGRKVNIKHWIGHPKFELIILEPSDEILRISDDIKSPYERLLEDLDERIIAYGFPISSLSMELENKREILNILNLTKTPRIQQISTFLS